MRKAKAKKEDHEERKPIKTLGERIIYCRLQVRFRSGTSVSQVELGKLVAKLLRCDQPVSGATVSRWESGEHQPDLSSIAAIAEISGVAPGWLAFGGGPSTTETVMRFDTAMLAIAAIVQECERSNHRLRVLEEWAENSVTLTSTAGRLGRGLCS